MYFWSSSNVDYCVQVIPLFWNVNLPILVPMFTGYHRIYMWFWKSGQFRLKLFCCGTIAISPSLLSLSLVLKIMKSLNQRALQWKLNWSSREEDLAMKIEMKFKRRGSSMFTLLSNFHFRLWVEGVGMECEQGESNLSHGHYLISSAYPCALEFLVISRLILSKKWWLFIYLFYLIVT